MNLLRALFFALLVRPLVFVLFGANVRHGARVPRSGPAIVVANHNSHLDTLVLMSLFPLGQLHLLRPVAAADYFTRNRLLGWFTQRLLQGILIARQPSPKADPFAELSSALAAGHILILYPEGSRGEPERLAGFKTGVAHLAKRHPAVGVYPVFMHGLGKVLPKNDWVPVPFFIDVFVGEPLRWSCDRAGFMAALNGRMAELAAEGQFPVWE